METPNITLPKGTRALVTGATGFTGSLLVKKLIDQGVEVVAIARPSSDLTAFADQPIHWHLGDVFDPDLVNQAAQNINYIFHLVTPFREAKSADRVYADVHIHSTQQLAKEALTQPDFHRFVHVSTAGVHGHVDHPPGDETCPFKPGDIYQETKLEGEIWLQDFTQETGLPTTIVRPAGIYGPGEKRLLKIFKWSAAKRVPVIGDGRNLLHFIHVEDLANFLILAAIHPRAVGETFICGSPKAMTFQKMVEIISEYYGVSAQFIKFPAAPLFALGDFFELICRPLKIEPPIYRRRLAFYTKDRSFNTEKMKRLLGFVPTHSDEEGLRELAQWYIQEGWISL